MKWSELPIEIAADIALYEYNIEDVSELEQCQRNFLDEFTSEDLFYCWCNYNGFINCAPTFVRVWETIKKEN